MSLADALKTAVANSQKITVCSVMTAKTQMKPEDIKTLESALYDRTIKATVLSRALLDEGVNISSGTITRHRNGWCKSC